MKRIFFVLAFMVILLSACMAPPTNAMPTPVESEAPALPTPTSVETTIATEPATTRTDTIPNRKLPAAQFTIQTPEASVVFLITAIGDQYLVLSGEGNLELVKEIVQRVRPISK